MSRPRERIDASGSATRREPVMSRLTGPTLAVLAKVSLLGLVLAIAVWAALPLLSAGNWIGLLLVVAATTLLFWIYLSPRRVPAKFLIPGTLFLIAFQVFPVVYTVGTAFSNFGDGHRGTKDQAVEAIETAAVQRVPDSAQYELSVATDGTPANGEIVFLLTDPVTEQVYLGTTDGLTPMAADDVQVAESGKVVEADGWTVLTGAQAADRSDDVAQFRVPTDEGAIRSQGLSQAYEGQAIRRYDAGCDCIRDLETGNRWHADDETGYFVDEQGNNLPQGWKVSVGLSNFTAVVSDPVIRDHFTTTLVWNIAFATVSVASSFALGLGVALLLNNRRLKGRRLYRSLLVLPYAMPAFAMLLVWRDMFNRDFGLLNRLFGVDVDWFGEPWTARLAVLLVQLWLGYPYMFLVCTGALQALPTEMFEAAEIDGAGRWRMLTGMTLPLLLVAVAPLLVASFAYNFNNFNAIYLTTEGGPFAPDSPQAGATDLLITYTYRLAFGAQGAEYGFAAAVSVYIFLIVALISAAAFRRTRALEEVHG